jgi:hypothetical protein
MALSLYDVSVASYLQTLGAVAGYLEKGLGHFKAAAINPDDVIAMRLYDDMLPFTFQIVSVCHHSRGAIAGAKAGVFTPPTVPPDPTYAKLQALVADAIAELKALSPDEVNALEGGDIVFKLGERSLPFKSVEDFLLSFSLPNFHFHATTAYDILRKEGVPLGKRDYLGGMRLKAA